MSRTPLRASDLALVAVGGALGALTRWAVGALWPTDGAAWDVVAINVVGALALGALPLLRSVRHSHRLTVLLGPGLLGGFTTVSAWVDDIRALAADGELRTAGVVLGVTVAAGLVAARLGRRLSHRPEPEDAVT